MKELFAGIALNPLAGSPEPNITMLSLLTTINTECNGKNKLNANND
jgi:hypothetical protein